jgi:hypothetical protein
VSGLTRLPLTEGWVAKRVSIDRPDRADDRKHLALELERSLPLALAARRFKGDGQGGCTFFTFAEARGPSETGRLP